MLNSHLQIGCIYDVDLMQKEYLVSTKVIYEIAFPGISDNDTWNNRSAVRWDHIFPFG